MPPAQLARSLTELPSAQKKLCTGADSSEASEAARLQPKCIGECLWIGLASPRRTPAVPVQAIPHLISISSPGPLPPLTLALAHPHPHSTLHSIELRDGRHTSHPAPPRPISPVRRAHSPFGQRLSGNIWPGNSCREWISRRERGSQDCKPSAHLRQKSKRNPAGKLRNHFQEILPWRSTTSPRGRLALRCSERDKTCLFRRCCSPSHSHHLGIRPRGSRDTWRRRRQKNHLRGKLPAIHCPVDMRYPRGNSHSQPATRWLSSLRKSPPHKAPRMESQTSSTPLAL